MARKYHTLLTRDTKTSPWTIQFGDYSMECVKEEREDMCYEWREPRLLKGNTKIITTGDKTVDIEAAVAKLNANRT